MLKIVTSSDMLVLTFRYPWEALKPVLMGRFKFVGKFGKSQLILSRNILSKEILKRKKIGLKCVTVPLIICIFLTPELMQWGASWCVQNIIIWNNSEVNTLIEVETESKLNENTGEYSPIEIIKLIIIIVEAISL